VGGWGDAARQALAASAYYVALVLLMRAAGKRLAGQTTTFDLIVLISLGVVLQTAALRPGLANALVFVVTVFALHRGLAVASSRSRRLRRLVRGAPRPLVVDGRVSEEALAGEGMSRDELLAGLRRLGYASPSEVRLAVLEETGHVSAVPLDRGGGSAGAGGGPGRRGHASPPNA
jgi:uncharacterized membrane protein YcaP (DUF421 family)